MELEVYLYASLAKYLPHNKADKRVMVSAPEGSTARDILEQLNVPEKEVKIAFVNGVRKGLDARVADGDRIGFFPPVGGG
ncbi:MAG: MoaD/ThiS family protein [Thermodesulfobacteriota bacterium]